jgi:hypothetical protein
LERSDQFIEEGSAHERAHVSLDRRVVGEMEAKAKASPAEGWAGEAGRAF